MIRTMTSLLTASCAACLLATGCIPRDDAPAGLDKAIPTSDQVSIKLPASASKRVADPTVGQIATFYLETRAVTLTFNGASAWVLVLIHSIVQYPVTSVSGNTYTWGPWSGSALDPAQYKLDVTANDDGTYDYTLSGHNKQDTSDNFIAIIDGHADPRPGDNMGNGTFHFDFDASKTVDPIDNPNAKGDVDVTYDLAAMHLELGINSSTSDGTPLVGMYEYDQAADGGGDMTFDISANIGGTSAAEDLTLRSRWKGTGAGRGDARIAGGDLGSQQALASECWDTAFDRVYYSDNVNFNPTEGDPAQCAYSDQDLPPVD